MSHISAELLTALAFALVAIKVAASAVLLTRKRDSWFDTASGKWLWWATKITPLLAVPCMIAAALLAGKVGDAWAYGALMLFVLVAVPVVVWRRFRRDGP